MLYNFLQFFVWLFEKLKAAPSVLVGDGSYELEDDTGASSFTWKSNDAESRISIQIWIVLNTHGLHDDLWHGEKISICVQRNYYSCRQRLSIVYDISFYCKSYSIRPAFWYYLIYPWIIGTNTNKDTSNLSTGPPWWWCSLGIIDSIRKVERRVWSSGKTCTHTYANIPTSNAYIEITIWTNWPIRKWTKNIQKIPNYNDWTLFSSAYSNILLSKIQLECSAVRIDQIGCSIERNVTL